jgi:hypothetical protein
LAQRLAGTPLPFFITRFFGGVFGSAPVSNISAALGDIWEVKARRNCCSLLRSCRCGKANSRTCRRFSSCSQPSPWLALDRVYRGDLDFHDIRTLPLCSSRNVRTGPPQAQSPASAQGDRQEETIPSPREDGIGSEDHGYKHFSRPLLVLATEPTVTCIAFYASFVFVLLYMTLGGLSNRLRRATWLQSSGRIPAIYCTFRWGTWSCFHQLGKPTTLHQDSQSGRRQART